jgi:hypothetical protein
MTRSPERSMRLTAFAAFVFFSAATTPLVAQGSNAGDGVRFGISLGGISTVGLTVEIFRDTHAVDFGVGTWSFSDISVSVVYKEYIGGRALRPFLGAGFWAALAAPALPEERTGLALVLRAPLGVDWSFADQHSVGAALNLNRGLLVRRSDPRDDVPMNGRLVPLPELDYRFTP